MNRRTQLLAVVRKEVGQTLRDRRIMFMLVVAPLVQTILFGYAVQLEVDQVPTLVVDRSQGPESRRHLRELLADGTLAAVGRSSDPAAASRALASGEAAAAIILPPDFDARRLAGQPARVQVLIDGTDPNRATVAGAAVGGYFAQADIAPAPTAGAGAPGTRRPGPARLVPRVLFNPTLDSPPFMIPGVMAMLLVIVTTIVTAMGLAREREMGTLEQVMVTPIPSAVLLAGKMIPFLVIGAVDVALVLTAGAWLFGVPLGGSAVALVLGTLLYLMSTLGAGLFISTISRSQQQAFLAGLLFIQPAVLLSGVLTPVRSMPAWLQPLTWVNPVRFFVDLLRAVLLKGAGLGEVWVPLVALAVFGAALFGLAVVRFTRRLA